MNKKIPVAVEITGYLILSCIVTIIVTMIWQRITQEPREDVADTIRWALTFSLLFCSVPTLPALYLFQRQIFVPQIIVPVASLLLQTVWTVCLLNDIFNHGIWQIGMIFFPSLGIAGATILTAYLPTVRKGDFPISTVKLAFGVAAELLLTIALPLTAAFLLSSTK